MSASRHTYAVIVKDVTTTLNEGWYNAGKTLGNDLPIIIWDGSELAVFGSKRRADKLCASMNAAHGNHYEVITLR